VFVNQGSQILQKSRSHIQIRGQKSDITQNFEVIREIYRHLELCSRCKCTDTKFCM